MGKGKATWSPQQEHALKAVAEWLKDSHAPQVFRLFGFAGTGKTTLAVHLAEDVGSVLYGAFTGKAALVMRKKGCKDASTIHRMIYMLDQEGAGDPTFKLNKNSDVRDADLVIIDECSMVGEELGKDLLSFGTRVLVLGDPAQLPPVKDAGFFTEVKPDFMLTEVHRQARDNPIIRLSMTVREGGPLELGDHGTAKIVRRRDFDHQDVLAADQILVGLNRTRHAYNRRIRQLRGFADSPYPKKGERLICLRNDRPKKLLNGSMWDVVKCRRNGKAMLSIAALPEDADPGSTPKKVQVHPAFFEGTEGDLPWQVRRESSEFTFGYAITVHKAQGSQWDNVFLFDEAASFREHSRRWLYTGITRRRTHHHRAALNAMGADTKIQWADDTVNFWIGCTKVSAGCDFCYAEKMEKRLGRAKWAHGEPRYKCKGAVKAAFALERKAIREGRMRRVFPNIVQH